MKKVSNPLSNDEIDVIYKCLRANVLIHDFSVLTKEDWTAMLFNKPNINDNSINKIMFNTSDCYPKWRKIHKYESDCDYSLELNLHLFSEKFKDYIIYDVSTNKQKRAMHFRVPEYLIKEEFKKNYTQFLFGSLPIEKIKQITEVFGEFKQHESGVMSYLRIDDMCIYLHKYIEVRNNEVKYVHQYILESFQRFVSHEMLIFQRKNNYNFIEDFNRLITNKYTDEMFDKDFVHLDENELTVLKMRLI